MSQSMTHGQDDCACQTDYSELEPEEALRIFARIRSTCPALRLIVPADLWGEFRVWHEVGDGDAFHGSICLLALLRGYLHRVTRPIHRYLLDGRRVRKDLRRQYRRDLREHWMLCDDPLERHRRSRIFMGRLVELQCADWLEDLGWQIRGLEALHSGPDIEASLEGVPHAIEVKAIGAQDAAFASILRSLHRQPAIRSMSPDAAINYLLFRAYEAGKQLAKQRARRMAILVIDELSWHEFDLQLHENWIDWTAPHFLGNDPDWEKFLVSQEQRHPRLRGELDAVIGGLEAIWIVERQSGFAYRRQLSIIPRTVTASRT